ncbi:S8 family serine peptidase [Pontimicrobium aquaticum]|uniref:T9SS type A sorting domain-containing protein n=1 Tax=Pontimicrobium aquaticum TaxID=2565367 RepID=A0A4U0EWI8_9FLAO|nr:S8 family serine peptidase [Pontimicrobium aquaticum]TJY36306.1 T9SS type A sorting domain-containing protein [Pontimicrobium aquaticum]
MKKRLLFFALLWLPFITSAQLIEDAWVYFTDKEDVATKIANPLTILTQKTIDRKNKHSVTIDARDVPVNETYISQIKGATGITVYAKSKWFNAIHVRGTETDIDNLETTFSFIDHIEFADKSLNTTRISISNKKAKDKFSVENTRVVFNYGNTQNQVEMIKADDLHLADYTGEGVTVAVIDAGFPNVNTMGAFQRLRNNGDLLGGYDFVNRTTDVYASTVSDHGTKVLSTMAGYVENQYVGTAPDASYYLFLTEDGLDENPVEESYWVEAAERADSLGVDIVNTSLGYKDFPSYPRYDYTYADMDGNTAFITRGANIAFEKGLLLVNSAGNAGNNGVNAPADAAGVFAIAAVDANENYVSFSSKGSAIQPTHKPDVAARGGLAYVINSGNIIVQNNGTSFSSPIMAGGLACLIQALPNLTNAEIMQLVRESGSIYNTPNYEIGYGIPDLQQALGTVLNEGIILETEFKIFPNPVKNLLFINFPENVNSADVKVFDVLGKLVIDTTIYINNRSLNLSSLSRGMYIAKLQGDNKKANTFKLLKK